jgi:large subunit ribosomal protein L3
MIGLVAKKLGMSHIYREDGSMSAMTLVKVFDNCILDILSDQSDDFDLLLVGVEKTDKLKNVSKSVSGSFLKKGLPVHKKIYGFKVGKNLGYKVGQSLELGSLIKEGDLVSVTGVSTGKGFSGVMKRHNFRGLEASHGVSISHRSHGSTGQRQDPGKVFRGKKMAGHLGVERITVKNLEVMIINGDKKLVAIRGALPGKNGSSVILKVS